MPCATKHALSQRFARTEDETRDLATLGISRPALKIENFLEFWNQPVLKISKSRRGCFPQTFQGRGGDIANLYIK